MECYNKGDLDFSEVTSGNLDEDKGLTRDNDQSHYYFMNDNLFKHVNINKERTHLPDGTEPDSAKACDDYNKVIASVGGIEDVYKRQSFCSVETSSDGGTDLSV